MYKKREVIRVRYRNSTGTLSRPCKLQKLTYDDGSIEYHNMSMKSRKTGDLEHVTQDKHGNDKIHYSIDPETFITSWETKTKRGVIHKEPVSKKINEPKVETVRVRFYNKKKGNKLGRPTKVYKITPITKFSVKEGDNHVEKEKEGTPIYTPYVKGSRVELDPSTFVTEWEAGPTPTPRPPKEKRGFTCKLVKLAVRVYKVTFAKAREMFYSGEITIKEIQESRQLTNAEKRDRRIEQKVAKLERKCKQNLEYAKTREATLIVHYQDEVNGEVKDFTREFPIKGLDSNTEYRKFMRALKPERFLFSTIKYKEGELNTEGLRLEVLRAEREKIKAKRRQSKQEARKKLKVNRKKLKKKRREGK